MKKCLLILAAVLMLHGYTGAQNISDKEWSVLIKFLETEKWPEAEKKCIYLMSKFKSEGDTSYQAANLRFMFLVSVAGQLAHKDIDKVAALNKTHFLLGKTVVTPDREFKRKGMFNYFKTSEEDSTQLYCCQSNNDATEIQVFETYKMRNPVLLAHPDLLEGKTLRVKAIIKEIKAEGFAFPRLEVQFKDAYFYTD
jgi:hypothetical protein